MLRFAGTGVSHVGLVRPDNEDAAFIGPDLMLVADGVGGAAAGEVASATAAYAVAAVAMLRREDDPALVLQAAVRHAHEQVAAGMDQDPAREGMATTLTAVLTNGSRVAVAHLGDSRGFVLRGDELIQITRDHTWVARQVDDGALTEEQAAEHPWRNVVMRSLDGQADHHADVLPLALQVGDRLLLASDGLTDLVADDTIRSVLLRHDDDAAVEALQDAALAAGGRDNVTLVLATVIDGPRVAADGLLLGSVRTPANIVDAAAIARAHRSA